MMIEGLFACVFILLCLYAAMRDVETLTISNGLNAIIAFLFIPAMIVAAPGWDVAGGHLLAGVIAFVVSVLLFMLGVFGGGDAKMIPGVMLWLGPEAAWPFMTAMAVIGGVCIVIVAGMVTGTAGGVLRDVLCNDIPLIFQGELYATVSLITGVVYFLGLTNGMPGDLMVLVAIAIGFTLRVLALVLKWEMPKFVFDRNMRK